MVTMMVMISEYGRFSWADQPADEVFGEEWVPSLGRVI